MPTSGRSPAPGIFTGMHASLDELTLDARNSSSPAMARGIMTEAQDLLRNALDHGESERALAHWFSRTLQELMGSPALVELVDSARLLPTGALARGDATPTDTVTWIIVGFSVGGNERVGGLFAGAGLPVGELRAPASPEVWRERVDEAVEKRDVAEIEMFVDCGLLTGPTPADLLATASLGHLPPTLRLAEGLPDYSTPVDVRGILLEPAVAVARWAGLLADATGGDVAHRLSAAADRDVLTADEAEALTQAWDTGLTLELRRWRHHAWDDSTMLSSLPALDRSAYGAAARLVSVALRSLAGRRGVDMP